MAVQNVAEASSLRTFGIDTHDSAPAPGFRHFLGTPSPSQRFRAFGIDPLNSPAILPQLRGLMQRLSRRMDARIHWPHHGRSAENWENPFIPSGYTYLLQFVAHDLVHSAIPLSVAGGRGGGTANARRTPLRLETLFGSGPVGSPHIYALDAPNDDRRTKLRLGRMRWKENEPKTGCPFRDIARTRAENVTGIDRSIAGVRVALTEALVADPRNDDHAVMSQLTALFALLHNGLIDIIRRREAQRRDRTRSSAPPTSASFAPATALTADLSQHHPQRPDAARDPSGGLRGLLPAQPELYRPRHSAEASSPADWQIPFEFSHGAFRFGHAMVRPEYRSTTCHCMISTLRWKRTPRTTPSTCRWTRPGWCSGRASSTSTGRGPISAAASGRISATGSVMTEIFPAFDETGRVGLLYRDLLGAGLPGMWSVDALITEIGTRRPHFDRACHACSPTATTA